MPQRGLTLLELLITLVILSLILSFAVPGFQNQIRDLRAKTLTNSLYEAIQATRTRAISRNGRATLRALGDWNQGWELFDDLNHNGIRDPDEPLILKRRIESSGIRISGNEPVQHYVSYVGTGRSRRPNGTPRGANQHGTLKVCSEEAGGYKLVLSSMGRLRKQAIDAAQCQD